MLVAIAMMFSYIEAILPLPVGFYGMKLGLANLVVVVGLYLLKPREIFLISMIRIFLISLLFGNGMVLLYSLAGGICSFAVMWLLQKQKGFSVIGVSAAGGAAHNLAQIGVAAWAVQNGVVLAYAPLLLLAGTAAGVAIGVVAKGILPIIKKELDNV